MYVNKCIKCGKEFETKNPKRVICPECLYSDKKYTEELSSGAAAPAAGTDENTQRNSFSFGGERQDRQERPQRSYDKPYDRNFNRNEGRTPYNRQNTGFNKNRQGGNYQRPYNNNRFGQKNFQKPQRQGGFNGNRQNRPGGRPKPPKQLLISKEQLEQIEVLYKKALPLPNPDIHEVIGQAIGLEPRKVFFGINLIRQKLMLPKLPFPKRRLAVSPDQMFAVKNLYEPLLPLPPIGCHKIIAAQLRMDEWRVHVAIGLIRKQMGLDRWNQTREDAPEEYKKTS